MKVIAIIVLFAAIVTVAESRNVNTVVNGAHGSDWTIAGLSDDFEREHMLAVVKHLERNFGVHITNENELELVLENALTASHKTMDRFLDDLTADADEELNVST